MASQIELRVVPQAAALAKEAAARVVAALRVKPGLLLCAASGGTPTATYRELALCRAEYPGLFSELRILKLDEWGGIAMSHPASCESYLQASLIKPLEIAADRYFSCASNPQDPAAECLRLERVMQAQGPVDLCLLGLGLNGHLGFNEPAPQLEQAWHIAQLSPATLAHPMAAAMQPRPSFGITLGMAGIMQSKQVLLLVQGTHKQDVLARLMTEEISPQCPASYLREHRSVTVVCDEAAAAKL